MIQTEFYGIQDCGTKLYRTYSDADMYIVQVETGIEYVEAIDVESVAYTYKETDKKIELDVDQTIDE